MDWWMNMIQMNIGDILRLIVRYTNQWYLNQRNDVVLYMTYYCKFAYMNSHWKAYYILPGFEYWILSNLVCDFNFNEC